MPAFKKLAILILCLMLLSGCTLDSKLQSQYFSSTLPHDTQAGGADTTTPDVSAPNAATSPTISETSSFEIHFIDVGQADAALVICDGETALIDGGNAEDSNLIYSYLKKYDVAHLDYIVATHGHEDHCGGLSGALNAATAGTAFCSVADYDSKAFRNFVGNLNEQGKEISIPEPGYSFDIGSAIATVLGPLSPSEDPNNTSLVIKIEYGSTSFLFTGDAEYEEETEILDAGYSIDCTVLKVGHHGSDSSTSYRWLRAAAPEYAVISVGADNSYGHPTEDVLSRLRDADVTTYRTDMQGDIICTSDGSAVSFRVNRNADADTLAGAGAGGSHTEAPAAPTDPTEPEQSPDTNSEKTYVLNTNTKKFHYPSCGSAKKIALKNRKEATCSREELIEDGYEPCGNCDP